MMLILHLLWRSVSDLSVIYKGRYQILNFNTNHITYSIYRDFQSQPHLFVKATSILIDRLSASSDSASSDVSTVELPCANSQESSDIIAYDHILGLSKARLFL